MNFFLKAILGRVGEVTQAYPKVMADVYRTASNRASNLLASKIEIDKIDTEEKRIAAINRKTKLEEDIYQHKLDNEEILDELYAFNAEANNWILKVERGDATLEQAIEGIEGSIELNKFKENRGSGPIIEGKMLELKGTSELKEPEEETETEAESEKETSEKESEPKEGPTKIENRADLYTETIRIIETAKEKDRWAEGTIRELKGLWEENSDISGTEQWQEQQEVFLDEVNENLKHDKYGFSTVSDWSNPKQYEPVLDAIVNSTPTENIGGQITPRWDKKFDLLMDTIDRIEVSEEEKLQYKDMYYRKYMRDRKGPIFGAWSPYYKPSDERLKAEGINKNEPMSSFLFSSKVTDSLATNESDSAEVTNPPATNESDSAKDITFKSPTEKQEAFKLYTKTPLKQKERETYYNNLSLRQKELYKKALVYVKGE